MRYLESCPDCKTKRTEKINQGGLFELQVLYNDWTGKREHWWYTCWVCNPDEGEVF